MNIKFFNPPAAILASGTKEGVELGGSKNIISIDSTHNFYTEGNIFTEMSWAEFYKEEGIEDQIDLFITKEDSSIREDPEALVEIIVKSLRKIMKDKKLFYGIIDFEVHAFMNQNTVIPGLKLAPELINKLLDAHKKYRDEDLFPKIMQDKGKKIINISFQGVNKRNLHFLGSRLEDLADRLRLAKGFATGIVATSKKAANLFMMNDRIVFSEDEVPEFYIDQDCITVIEMGIQRKVLFPISWFRIDIGIRSFETLELWETIKENPELQKVLEDYDNYVTSLVLKKYMNFATTQKIGEKSEDDFYNMTLAERKKALKDMRGAIKFLTKEYKKS